MVGLEKTACLLVRCTVYEFLYTNGESAASKPLEKTILHLFITILRYLADPIQILNGEYSRLRLYRR